MKGFKGC